MKKSSLLQFQILLVFTLLMMFFTTSAQDPLLTTQLWGMTHEGGTVGGGTIFKINADGTNLSVVHSFDNVTGGGSRNSMIQTSDGSILGMTQAGGSNSSGVIFKINKDGSDYRVVHDFEGGWPIGSLIQASDGFLFGVSLGSVFRTNADGTNYTVLHDFDNSKGTNVAAGSLMQASDGSLYGMTNTFFEGPGSIFKINTDGSGFTVLSNFDSLNVYPHGAVVEGTDGALYGTTSKGGAFNYGTIFKINTDGSNYTALHSFTNADGRFPYNGMTAATDGWLYGMTYLGGNAGGGTLFKIKIDGSGFTVLHHFDCNTGCAPTGNLIIFKNKLYGYTTFGDAYNTGTIFSYDLTSNIYNKLSSLNGATGKEPMFGSLLLINPENDGFPLVPASNISFSNIFSTSMTVSFTPGDGNNHLVVMRTGAPPALKPVNNTSYTGNLGHGEMVVSNGPDHIVNITGLQSYRTYFFTVFEYNTDSLGSIKYLVNNAPVAVQRTRLLPDVYLVKPSNGVSNQYVRLTLKAKEVEGAATYTFEISSNADFIHPKILISNSVSQSIDSLQYNTRYYARVKTNLRPDYGKITTFTTRTAESLAYVTWPANGAVNVKTTTAIASNSVPYASEYTIQLSETIDFATVAFEQTSSTRIMHFSGLKYGTLYYSRVRVNLSENFGAIKHFQTEDAAPSIRTVAEQPEPRTDNLVVNVYQNPFADRLTFEVESSQNKNAKITLLNLDSKPLHQSVVKTNTVVDMDAPFPNGVYILKVEQGATIKAVRVVKLQ